MGSTAEGKLTCMPTILQDSSSFGVNMTARNADTDAGVSSLNMASVRDFIADRHKFRCTCAAERSICWPHTQMSIGNEKDRIDRNAQGQAPNLNPPQGATMTDSKTRSRIVALYDYEFDLSQWSTSGKDVGREVSRR